MITTTDAQIMETLREVVAERPEYTYSPPEYMVKEEDGNLACFYVHQDEEGEPVAAGCAIGVVLNRLGVPLPELGEHEGRTAVQLIRDVTEGVSRKSAAALSRMQEYQDEGDPWGTAYAKATGETI